MKLKHLLFFPAAGFILLFSVQGSAQPAAYVKQVITANSGKFEYTPPYTDFVTLQRYDPQTRLVSYFSSIFTQSAQSILISGEVGFFAAQDSVVKFNLNTFQRMAAVADSGLNRLALYNGRLLVSKQYPVSRFFMEVLDTSNLSLIARVDGLTGDCGGISGLNDTVYIAVNGGWMGSEGKLGIIDPATWTLQSEVNFGSGAVGIWDLYVYNRAVYSVNKTPYGVPEVGSVTVYNPATRGFFNVILPFRVAAGTGINKGLLYLGLNYGIGSFNLNTRSVADTILVPDPGSSEYTYILSSAIDTLDGKLYTNVGNYVTPGYCLVTSLSGDSITSFPTGISSDAIAVDTRTDPVGIAENSGVNTSVRLYPNPVYDILEISVAGNISITSLKITAVSGREMIKLNHPPASGNDYKLAVSDLTPGLYYLVVYTSEGRVVKPFVVGSR